MFAVIYFIFDKRSQNIFELLLFLLITFDFGGCKAKSARLVVNHGLLVASWKLIHSIQLLFVELIVYKLFEIGFNRFNLWWRGDGGIRVLYLFWFLVIAVIPIVVFTLLQIIIILVFRCFNIIKTAFLLLFFVESALLVNCRFRSILRLD